MRLNHLLTGIAVSAVVAASAFSASAAPLFYNFSWADAGGDWASGQLQTDGFTTITDFTGTQHVGASSSAITGTSPYAFADQQFYDPPASPGQYFTVSGASYKTALLGDWNLYYYGGLFSISSNVDPVGYVSSGVPITFRVGTAGLTSETAGAIPEPASWALMILGFGGVGVGARAKRKQRQVALA
jgi:hypothetical protein